MFDWKCCVVKWTLKNIWIFWACRNPMFDMAASSLFREGEIGHFPQVRSNVTCRNTKTRTSTQQNEIWGKSTQHRDFFEKSPCCVHAYLVDCWKYSAFSTPFSVYMKTRGTTQKNVDTDEGKFCVVAYLAHCLQVRSKKSVLLRSRRGKLLHSTVTFQKSHGAAYFCLEIHFAAYLPFMTPQNRPKNRLFWPFPVGKCPGAVSKCSASSLRNCYTEFLEGFGGSKTTYASHFFAWLTYG